MGTEVMAQNTNRLNEYQISQLRKFRELMRMCSEAWEMAERNHHG